MAQYNPLKPKHYLRRRLINSYLIVIAIFLAMLAGFITLHFSVVREYKTISETMIAEYRLLDQVPVLIDAYNNAFKSLDSDNNVNTTQVVAAKVEIHTILRYLDTAIVDENSRNDYIGLKNTIQSLEREIDRGLEDLQGGKVSSASSYYDAASKQHAFVKTNTITLILDQLRYTSTLQEKIDNSYKTALALATIIFGLTLVGILLYILTFAQKLTTPLQRLNAAAQNIAAGGKKTSLPTELTKGEDEISSLGRSFGIMVDKLLESSNRHDALLFSIGDGVIATDASGKVDYINTAAQKLLRLNEDEVIGRQYDQLWHLEHEDESVVETNDQPIDKALKKGESTSVSTFYYARTVPNGERVRFPVSTNVSPIKIDDKITGMVAVFRDITHEKEVDRMKTEFISLASHQLKTPLSAINWFGELLADEGIGKLSADQRDFLENIRGSARRMTDLVSALLNISRMEAGRIIVKPIPTSLSTLVSGVVNDLKAKSSEKQHTITIDVPTNLPNIPLDPDLVGQVYMNLLSNAVKYTPKGGVIAIKITVKNDQIFSEVSDNGYGIPEVDRSKMFQKFFRADNIMKIETDGTGLGLYLVKSIVESCGGEIGYTSEINKGTTFWFTLPLAGMRAKEGEVGLESARNL